ncbi:MAG: DNA polymerase I [Pseudomonadota bacterium]
MNKGDHLFLVDGSAYIFRADHALPPLTRKSDGLPIGAVSGFCNMLWKLLQEARDTSVGVVPTHFAVIFDHSSTTFRNEIYPEYKANRDAPPEDLRSQFAVIREATRAFDVPCIEKEGFEADDLIATYARVAVEAGGDVTIISSDKDLMQLVSPRVIMYDTMKDRRVGEDEVVEKFGVGPEKMIDLQALSGDSTDNIPGVPGIGPKTAAQLLEEFGTLETLLERAGEIKQNKRRENLIEFADQARLSKRLVTLDQQTPLDVPLTDLQLNSLDGPKLIAFLKGLELNTLTRRVAAETETDAAAVDAATLTVGDDQRGPDFDGTGGRGSETSADAADNEAYTPGALAGQRAAQHASTPVSHDEYETVRDMEALNLWIALAMEQGHVAVDTETTSLDAMQANLVGVSLALAPGKACYIPLDHVDGEGDLLGGGARLDGQIPLTEALAALKPLLEAPSVLKIAQNIKYDWLVLSRYDIEIAPFDDTMLLSYALDAGRAKHGMDGLSQAILGHMPIPFKEVAGSGKGLITFDKVSIEKAAAYAAEDADVTLRLWEVLKPRLVPEGMTMVYERLERPLVDVICRMEARGISVDRQILSRLSGDLAQKAAGLEDEIYKLAGQKFNVGSPKQLGEILFDQMGLPGGKKTKTGQWATGAQQLEDLAAEGHELPRKIVDWRQLTKLKSTYTDALPGFINPTTKRVHTSYAMAATTTGRLSSSDPNLQNIPVRTEAGRKIRTAFVAESGNKLLSADYSQIELRVLAHVADIPQLKQAFADGMDIHAITASEMFGVPIEGMDPMVRRQAKAINFGIIYGISAFGLANNLGIERSEASDYIKKYFERFPGIRDYMDLTKEFCREHGYVETIFGRRAHYPDIRASNPQVRAFNERAAINAPIQGSAADIIRRAMVRMDRVLEEADLRAQMLLQVHDELIFEVPEDEVEATIPLVSDVMIDAPNPAIALKVPLQVDARAADNWDEAH